MPSMPMDLSRHRYWYVAGFVLFVAAVVLVVTARGSEGSGSSAGATSAGDRDVSESSATDPTPGPDAREDRSPGPDAPEDTPATPDAPEDTPAAPAASEDPPTGGDDPPDAPSAAVSDARDTVDGYLDGLDDLLTAPTVDGTDDTEALEDVATGSALDEIVVAMAEFQENDWRQVGSSSVVWARVTDRSDTGGLTVRACLDSSAVQILDEQGNDLRSPSTPDRSVNIYTLVPAGAAAGVAAGSGFLVEGHSFPAKADC